MVLVKFPTAVLLAHGVFDAHKFGGDEDVVSERIQQSVAGELVTTIEGFRRRREHLEDDMGLSRLCGFFAVW